jgi:hypothetical protein
MSLTEMDSSRGAARLYSQGKRVARDAGAATPYVSELAQSTINPSTINEVSPPSST